jgi:hypothetical protein
METYKSIIRNDANHHMFQVHLNNHGSIDKLIQSIIIGRYFVENPLHFINIIFHASLVEKYFKQTTP